MSKITVDTLEPSTGTSLTLGASGDTISVPSGATLESAGQPVTNAPAFEAYKNSTTGSLADNTSTKVAFDVEVFDTDSAYDHSTNHRFTVPSGKAGKYHVYTTVYMFTAGGATANEIQVGELVIKLNGSSTTAMVERNTNGYGNSITMQTAVTLSLSAGDYIEVWGKLDTAGGVTWSIGGTTFQRTTFGAFRLIGV